MTKKTDKDECKEECEKEVQPEECSSKDCAACDAKRRYEIALMNAELIIQEAEDREAC